ncbi:TM2 domain-containing protein 3,TM2 domain-containing protein C41D11.9,TM2 domain-containing protein almondex [Mytilus coruscus]|uniref:TM2 domain-containing protein 3,TM2 domain-containing protein C41D11.9,TM2 domain-containing protein almondex n=1 Tax=Mytilus coruscus TaxID=42192 RepID=A0A6J8DNT4_MYTCO|nr:TM2 domain-containing protein 3,TM2 domain-containing protein C41D11.9,TM2 domain-containing protein almondex [Mytilus coruscus]
MNNFTFSIYLVILLLIHSSCVISSNDNVNGQGSTPTVGKEVTSPSYDVNSTTSSTTTSLAPEFNARCPDNVECYKLGGECINCKYNKHCFYGKPNETSECQVKEDIKCIGQRKFNRTHECKYCYQLDKSNYSCDTTNASCQVINGQIQKYIAQCTVKHNVLCLGQRTFLKNLPCNWTSGYKWSTALILSITLGGFGVDRFYLGLWKEGIGKLFSFGGLGVWTLVDVILIAIGYVGPSDGSLYI